MKLKKLWPILAGSAIFIFAFIHTLQAAGKNIVPNPGFEEMDIGNPNDWGSLPPKWTIDRETAHSGKNSLCIRNSDPNFYANPKCTIVPKPGGHYDISVWVKLENVKGGSASFMVEFWGKNGYMGGTWNAPELTGTTGDWRRLIFENRVIPKSQQIDWVSFTVFLTKGATGTAWFDDIKMEKVSSSVFETFLLHPNYRGWILPVNKKKEIEMEVELNPKLLNCALKDLELNAVLRKTRAGSMIDKDSEVSREQKWAPPPSAKFTASLDVSGIPAGEYEFLAYLRNSSGKIIDMDTYKLKKLSAEEFGKLKTYFDENCVFHVDGKPYFPLGWYTCPEWYDGDGYVKYCNPEEIASDGPFNTVIFYGPLWKQMLDGIDKHGIKILGGAPIGPFNHGEKRSEPAVRRGEELEIKNFILKFKDHPAILGWYINDEVPTDNVCYPTLVDHYRWISETDPDHPTYAVHMNLGDLKHGAFVTDVLGVDPYPIRTQELTWVCDMTEEAVKAGHGTRPVWTVLQAHPASAYAPNHKEIPPEQKLADAPTQEEVRCMTYLAIVSGAKGLFYYSFFDIKSHLPDFQERMKWHKAIASEIAWLSPVIFSAEDIGKAKITCDDKDICCLLKKHNDKYYFITANSKKEKKKFTFGIAGINIAGVSDCFNENQNITLENNSFSQEYEPYGTCVYILTEKK